MITELRVGDIVVFREPVIYRESREREGISGFSLEILSQIDQFPDGISIGGGRLLGWPDGTPKVIYLSAGTRQIDNIVAHLGRLSESTVLNAFVRGGWNRNDIKKQIKTTYYLPPVRVILPNLDPEISINNLARYLGNR